MRKTIRRALAALLAVLMCAASLSALDRFGGEQAAAAAGRSVYIYGDSLTADVHDQLGFQLGLYHVPSVIKDHGGTALCDWIPAIQADVSLLEPRMVVIQFSGNAMTACMAGTGTQAAWLAKYQADLDQIATWLHSRGVPLAVVGSPPSIHATGEAVVMPTDWSVGQIPEGYAPTAPVLNDMYSARVAAYRAQGWDVSYVRAGDAVAAPNGQWTYVLPCLSFETPSMGCDPRGLMIVRAPDFGHFCPSASGLSAGVTCAVWSGGAWRYAAAISSFVSATAPLVQGYWMTASDGGVFAFGAGAHLYGSTGGIHLYSPVVGMAADPATGGYWLVSSDGGVFAFNAPFYGSTGGVRLAQPIVGMAAAPDGRGYWLVARDGGVFSFGSSAHFFGSAAGARLVQPIVGMAAAPGAGGYWLVAGDGGIFAFGPSARFFGSTGGVRLVQPIVGMAAAPDAGGYWLVARDGGIFAFGPSARFFGSTGGVRLVQPVVGMAVDGGTGGYWMVAADGGVFAFHAPFLGSTGGATLNKPIVGMASGS